MARRIVHQLVDDLDGSELEIGDGETVLFSLDGIAYEIDLSDRNATALRELLAPYAQAARTISRSASNAAGSTRGRGRGLRQDFSAVRAWAKDNGFEVSERGRVPATVLEAYEAAH